MLSTLLRAAAFGDQSLAKLAFGIGVFFYGGIVAIPCYMFVGSLMVLTTKTTRGQRAGEILAAAVGAAAWIGFFIGAIGDWPQLCIAYSLAVIGIIGWLARMNWNVEEGPSPELMLKRLSEAKDHCPHRATRSDAKT